MIGKFKPFWLQAGEHRLYAALHQEADPSCPPRSEAAPAVLLLPPLLHEYHRTLQFMAELASALACAGMPCLRFCHHGTGDSEGDGCVSLEQVIEDIEHAALGLAREFPKRPLVVLAFRSAALALQAWLERGGHASTVVLWDPVLDGAQWLQLRRMEDEVKRATIQPRPEADTEFMGCRVSQHFLTQLQQLRWQPGSPARKQPLWLVSRPGQQHALPVDRHFLLPAGVPAFGEGVLMDASLVFAKPVQSAVQTLSAALGVASRETAA